MTKVLIVDDSPTETFHMSNILEKKGYVVMSAESGQAGVDLAKQQKPDVILMDVVMPGLNGFQATRLLSKDQETEHIPVVIVTTKDQQTDKMWGIRQGAKAYLTKPISERHLLDAITTVMN